MEKSGKDDGMQRKGKYITACFEWMDDRKDGGDGYG